MCVRVCVWKLLSNRQRYLHKETFHRRTCGTKKVPSMLKSTSAMRLQQKNIKNQTFFINNSLLQLFKYP